MSEVEEVPQPKGPDEPEPEPEPTPEPEPEPEPTPEPEPEPEPQGARDDSDIEDAVKRLNSENTRHANAVSKIMGEDAQGLLVCPLCDVPGFVWSSQSDEQKAEKGPAVLAVLGLDGTPQLREAPDTEACPTCGGMGDLLTGAKVDRGRVKQCMDCAGQGWRQKMTPVPQLAPVPPMPAMTQPQQWTPPPGFHLVPDNAAGIGSPVG